MITALGLMLMCAPFGPGCPAPRSAPPSPQAIPGAEEPDARAAAKAPVPQGDGRWNLDFSPYMWFAAVDVNDGALDLSFSDLWDDLDGALMFSLDADKDGSKWGFLLDTVFFDLEDDPGGVDVDLRATTLSQYVKYRLDTKYPVELLAGVRYWNLSVSAGALGGDGEL